jgi:putative ABC transport system permease protein
LALVGAGLAIGAVASFGLTQFMASLLYEVRPTDLATSVIVAIVLACVALAAAYLPARRAMRIDPIVALRYE